MPCTLPRTVSVLVLALAAGTGLTTPCLASAPTSLAPAKLTLIQSQRSARTSLATSHVLELRDLFGLDSRSSFVPQQTLTNPQGRTVVRFQQTFEGCRVWAGEIITHVEADGQVKALTNGVKTGVSLASTSTRLSADQARDIALHHLAPKGPLGATPKVELVVFPTRFTGGFATRFDSVKGGEVLDRDLSVWAKAPADAYVQAYEVKTLLSNTKDGHKEIAFIVDANTGAVLRKWNALQADSPAQGIGNSYYRGTVPLATAAAADTTFSLHAMDKGTLPNPYIYAQDPTIAPGLAIYYGIIDWTTSQIGFVPFQCHATDTWGDGSLLPFPWDAGMMSPLLDYSSDGSQSWFKGALTPTGETAAVDAHFGLSTTWDFYRNVFQRDGVDNLGTSTFAIVHSIEGNGILADNAYWDPYYFGMHFGEGSYPAYPQWTGMLNTTELDITGHELTHGVTQTSVGTDGLIYAQQSGGLNESTSDILGKMVQAYADSGGAVGTSIPDFPAGDLTPWKIGHLSVPTSTDALRFMYKPSLDGISTDCWYDGVNLIDVHFSSGAPNRFFFFLSAGASSNVSSVTYSPYLPGGMAGIGNDRAARIWYKTLTEHLASDADFEAARAGSITSAQELFGVGSLEETAVKKAWAAVNVGAAPGQPTPVRVTFPVIHPEGSFLDLNVVPSGLFAKVQLFPLKSKVAVQCNVTNTTNKKVTWSVPTWSTFEGIPSPVGFINADGTWTTPDFNYYYDLLNITVTSQADPNQFAKSRVLLVPADADTDDETDALDMGAAAMSWGLPNTPNPSAWVAGSGDDWSIVFLREALTNAFPVN